MPAPALLQHRCGSCHAEVNYRHYEWAHPAIARRASLAPSIAPCSGHSSDSSGGSSGCAIPMTSNRFPAALSHHAAILSLPQSTKIPSNQISVSDKAHGGFLLPFRHKSSTSAECGSSVRRGGVLLACASTPSPSSGPQWLPNPMELVRREAGLQSNRLDSNLRERVEAAVAQLGGRVTVGDVATRAGVKLADADEALKALAYDTQASLKVSSEGDVVYGFAPDFQNRLRNRSLLITALPQIRRVVGVLSYLTRIAFGTALFASIALVWLAIAALLSGRSNDDRDNRRHSGYGGAGGRITFYVDPFDLFRFWDPYYGRDRLSRVHNAESCGISFVEAIFSFVFGDGDPNTAYDEQRWKVLGDMIRKKGGVVTAEEIAPLLDPPSPAVLPRTYSNEPYVPYPDESFVLPALIKFGGEPEVDDQGRILYRFPALQKTGVQQRQRSRSSSAIWDVPLEQTWELTAADAGQVAGIIFLGLVNLLGVGWLSFMLGDSRAPAMLAMQGLGFLVGLMGPLQLYAAAFFVIPATRWLLNQFRNGDIEVRNEARQAAIDLLDKAESAPRSSPVATLGDKVAAARALSDGRPGMELAEPRLVRDEEIIFDSDRELGRQIEVVERDDWDQRLAQRQRKQQREDGWDRSQGRW
ncbi:hypothetical protein VaNZ11_011515 [Volvox africanus]|uniref:Iron-sulfur cluster biosynthesis family protein n=1 Tax=Volvox africanus TaxID=51714 RepID=A0ABQ5SDB8_9CHLO|nr:hypothetical protein VaNZ11_011515 [Volvox africanus]